MALTGDLIDRRTRDLAPVLDLAARLQAIAPTYVVLGNHEADSPLRRSRSRSTAATARTSSCPAMRTRCG